MFMSLGTAGCIVAVQDTDGRPRTCRRPPTHAGLTGAGRFPNEVWVVFACEQHADQLVAARPMLDRDRQLLDDRGKRRGGGRTPPVATGAEARRLMTRARTWAENNPL